MRYTLCYAVLGILACSAFAEDVASIPGLAAWYRADNASKGAGDVLTTLNDCSGKGQNINGGPKAPMVVENVAHGKPVLRFSGKEPALVNAANNWSAEGFTAYVVAAFDDVPAKPSIRDGHIIETPGKALISDGGSAGLALGLNWNGRPGAAGGISLAGGAAFEDPFPNEQSSDLLVKAKTFYAFGYSSAEGKHNDKANAWDCRMKVAIFVNDAPSSILTTPFVSMQAMNGGKKLEIGAASGKNAFKGDIAEVILYSRELSEAERAKVFAYLRNKYDLQEAAKRLPTAPVVFTPSFDNRAFWFRESANVELSSTTDGAEIRYTTDGTAPTKASTLYVGPVKLTTTTTVTAQAFAARRDPSPVATAAFTKVGPVPQTANALKAGWKFSWGDEFDGPTVNEAIWGYEIGYVRNSEAQYYSNRTENSRIDNGNLLIQGLHDNWNGHKYTSASRSTENKVTLTYGKYEMRGKIDVRSGSWPAWWLWSRPDAAGWPKEGEIDMMEYYTGKCLFNVMNGAAKWFGGNRKKSIVSLGGDRWAQEFHVWTMDWDANKIDLYLDGALMVHYPVDDANGTGPNGANPYRNPQTKKMILNQALGGSSGGQLNEKDAPFEFRVDWVRVHTWSEEPAYTLTVNGGIGTGPYVVGTKASITANMPPPGYVFDKWVLSGEANVQDASNPSATVMMPKCDVTVTATYLPN
ncbi:MAG TPA: chitobiase/beta-hexosaminidase C-terminal domain-containing protein [Planctomycetota bacterium]|jgi:beta-glucanase (GH16 family)